MKKNENDTDFLRLVLLKQLGAHRQLSTSKDETVLAGQGITDNQILVLDFQINFIRRKKKSLFKYSDVIIKFLRALTQVEPAMHLIIEINI